MSTTKIVHRFTAEGRHFEISASGSDVIGPVYGCHVRDLDNDGVLIRNDDLMPYTGDLFDVLTRYVAHVEDAIRGQAALDAELDRYAAVEQAAEEAAERAYAEDRERMAEQGSWFGRDDDPIF